MEWLGFSGLFIDRGFVWTIATFPFFHTGPLHLIVNLLGLHFIGRSVESELGIRNFYWLCALSVLFGALLWLVFHYSDQSTYLSGINLRSLVFANFFLFQPPGQTNNVFALVRASGYAQTQIYSYWRVRARAVWLSLLGASRLRRRGNLLFSFGWYACGGFCLLVYSFWTGFSKFRFYHKEASSLFFGKKNLVFSLPKPKQPNRVIPSICRIIRSFKPRSIEFWTKSTRRVSVL